MTVPRVYLSRRNLLVLLSKLDRKAAGEETACMIAKNDNTHAKYPQTMARIEVCAVEDDEYYTHRNPGMMHPADRPDDRPEDPPLRMTETFH